MTRLEQLKDAIGVLAASPEDQQSYLAEIGHFNLHPVDKHSNIDELALQFEDANYLVPGLTRNHDLTAEAAHRIEELNKFMLGLAGSNGDFWTLQALYEDSRWAQVRTLAQKCLSEMT